MIEGTFLGASADLNGNFVVTGIPSPKNYLVKISYLGYDSQIIPVNTLMQIG
ncbi:MAG: carboxypeptidase-like regulatory domain-containing protein [Ignavibacteriales bacterium]|nr:carboxypeptidase-like regulatory domain-containing protein [Ignavibacteriales bacterium]